jgi:YihY family inner membrane protein
MSKILGPVLGPQIQSVARDPLRFVMRTIKSFRANQGMLLAGAVAYYALLSIVPLLILIVIVLSKFVGQKELLDTLAHLLEWLVPGQARAIVRELANFLEHRAVIGWLLAITMIFFSSLAFTVLENAMSVIFVHRVAIRRRHFLLSALLPYCYILFLGVGMLIVTLVSNGLQAMGDNSVDLLGIEVSLRGVSRLLLYLLGVAGEIFVLTSIYLVMPVGRPSLRLALLGSVTAAILWEITRHVLVWYFATLSQVSVVYGSLTTSIVVLFSLEALATLLLFGAQVISEFERFGSAACGPPEPFTTE